jgi:hypothetical protein
LARLRSQQSVTYFLLEIAEMIRLNRTAVTRPFLSAGTKFGYKQSKKHDQAVPESITLLTIKNVRNCRLGRKIAKPLCSRIAPWMACRWAMLYGNTLVAKTRSPRSGTARSARVGAGRKQVEPMCRAPACGNLTRQGRARHRGAGLHDGRGVGRYAGNEEWMGNGNKKWCGWLGSNQRPLASEANTLSTELQPHGEPKDTGFPAARLSESTSIFLPGPRAPAAGRRSRVVSGTAGLFPARPGCFPLHIFETIISRFLGEKSAIPKYPDVYNINAGRPALVLRKS